MRKLKKKAQHLPKKKQSKVSSPISTTLNKKSKTLSALLVFCIPVLIYLQTVTFGLVNFDDNSIITKNIAFLDDLHNAPKAFLTDAFIDGDSHFYRPMQTLSYMVDIQLSGMDNTWMFHLTNIILLGCIALLLFLILTKFLIPQNLAIFSALIYCAHPLFISNVAWIPARGDLQLMLFTLMAFLFFIEFIREKALLYLLFSWVAFTIALFSKETAAMLPFVFFIYYFTFTSEKRFENKYAFIIALYALSGIFWFWLRSKAINDLSNWNEILGIFSSKGEIGMMAFLYNLQTIPETLTNFIIPFDIDLLPSFSLTKAIIGSGIILFIGFLLFKNKGRPVNKKIFSILWFLLLLMPTMLFKHNELDYLNHRFFLPLVGMLFFILFLFPEKWPKKSKIQTNWILLTLFLVFSVITFVKMRSYADPMTFYNSAIKQNHNSDFAYIHRGYLYETKGQYNKSIRDFTKAIEINPDYPEAYNNRGNVYSNLGQYDKAITDFTRAIELKPNIVEAYNNRGLAYVYKKLYTKAIDDYIKVIELKPDLAEGYNNLGMAYGNQGIYDKALDGFKKAIELDPDYGQAYNNRGLAYMMKGYFDSACADFKKAQELGFEEAENNVTRFCK